LSIIFTDKKEKVDNDARWGDLIRKKYICAGVIRTCKERLGEIAVSKGAGERAGERAVPGCRSAGS
jgi:hypothetical protein